MPVSTAIDYSWMAWLTDPHRCLAGTTAGIDPTLPHELRAWTDMVNSYYRPGAVVCTGDLGERQTPAGVRADLRGFRLDCWDRLNAPVKVVEVGNHDSSVPYTTAGSDDFTDARLVFPEVGATAGTSATWSGTGAPGVTLITARMNHIHVPDVNNGRASITQSEIDRVEAILLAAANSSCIIFSHYSSIVAIGDSVLDSSGGTNWKAMLAARAAKIIFVGSGHRHIPPTVSTLSGVTHIAGACLSYYSGPPSSNSGGWMALKYNGSNAITMYMVDGRPPYAHLARATWTPQVFNI